MIIKRIKYFMSPENKARLRGAIIGAIGLPATLSLHKDTRGLAPMLAGAAIGAIGGSILGHKAYKDDQAVLEKRSQDYRRQKEEEELRKTNIWRNTSPDHNELYNIKDAVQKFEPRWGDGDEYPCLILFYDTLTFSLDLQEREYIFKDGKWYLEGDKTPIPSLRKNILDSIDYYEKDWNNIDYLDDDQIKPVLNYLAELKKAVKKSKLR